MDAPAGSARWGGRLARGEIALATLVALGLTALWIACTDPVLAWGWDETMHAQLAAAGMLFGLQEGDPSAAAEALLACERYPFGFPLVLALGQSLLAVSEASARAITTVTFGLSLCGLFALGRELRRRLGTPERPLVLLPWIALALPALSPLAIGYSGTVFLEVPFLSVAVFALWAWLRRRPEHATRDLLAGALLAAAFFTKFNYGAQLWAGLFLDGLVGLGRAPREERREELASLLRTAAIPLAALLWWFVLPLPGGLEVGARHRVAFLSFLGGNQEAARTPDAFRAVVLFGSFVPNLRFGLLALVGLSAALFASGRAEFSRGSAFDEDEEGAESRRRALRPLVLVFATFALPIGLHPFFLDRFLIPVACAFWPLVAFGGAWLLPAAPRRALAAVLALVALTFLAAGRDAPFLMERLGLASDELALRVYQRRRLADWRDLSPCRERPSAGLRQEEHERLADLVFGAVEDDEHVGWIGGTDEFSPAATHLALVERGGPRRRFLDDAHRLPFHTFSPVDPGWSPDEVERMAAGFDVLLFTEPVHMKRGGEVRAYMRGYRQALIEAGWRAEPVGGLTVRRSGQPSVAVELSLLRRP